MRLLACLIVAPQRGYDEPAILSYAISSFCPTSADGLHVALHVLVEPNAGASHWPRRRQASSLGPATPKKPGAPEGSLDPPRAPSPSHPIPRRREQQEHVCVLWLAWGGLNQGTETTKYGLRRAGRPPTSPRSPRVVRTKRRA